MVFGCLFGLRVMVGEVRGGCWLTSWWPGFKWCEEREKKKFVLTWSEILVCVCFFVTKIYGNLVFVCTWSWFCFYKGKRWENTLILLLLTHLQHTPKRLLRRNQNWVTCRSLWYILCELKSIYWIFSGCLENWFEGERSANIEWRFGDTEEKRFELWFVWFTN